MADNKLLSLLEIFNQKFFRIPDYQRGYSWLEEPQLDDFWEDLLNLKEGNKHYTGLLAVQRVDEKDISSNERWAEDRWLFKKGLSAYYIIDGQQRLITLIICIDQILRQFNDDESINLSKKETCIDNFLYQSYSDKYKSYIFGYEKDDPSDEYFKTKILDQESSTADKVPDQTLYTANLAAAKEYFHKKFADMEKPELENIYMKATSKLMFNLYEIDDELDVYVTFETMNNRGKPLSNLELLKNRLIYLTTLTDYGASMRLRKDVNETWKTIYEYLGKNKENLIGDDVFLRNHWLMYFKYDGQKQSSFSDFLLKDYFTARNFASGELDTGHIKKYIDSLASAVKEWFYLNNPEYSHYEDETKQWIQKLNRLGMASFQPLLMAAMMKATEKEFQELFIVAEKFNFLVFFLSYRNANNKQSHYYQLAHSFYQGETNKSIGDVISDVRYQTEGEEGERDTDDYMYYGEFNLKRFEKQIEEHFQKKEGYYSWKGIRYFLYEYELYLQEQANGNEKVSWVDFNKRKKEDTIEHIYPQKPTKKCWTPGFVGYTGKQKKILLNSLGNLVLLARKKNSELSNNCFEYKKKYENKKGHEVGYHNGSYSEIEVNNYKGWTPVEIMDRGEKMIKFLEERWGIDLEEWDDLSPKKLLNLEFM